MLHLLYLLGYGFLLGLGAAMPVGPVNLEIVRRNLRHGTPSGIFLGLGASCTDLTYLILLTFGALTLLTHAIVIKVVAVVGALILAWFGLGAIRMSVGDKSMDLETGAHKHPLRNMLDGYLMTLVNPMTIIFWSSVSSQVALLAHHAAHDMFYTGFGVILGASGWAISLNTVLHFTRHKISARTMHIINIVGGVILIAFALLGLWHGFFA
jgi:L-lysine exporter family protein LysE/ArgO